MATELKQYYVAFLDILGFSEMVNADVVSDDQPNLNKLFRCHQSAANIFKDDPGCSIIQFSDSIVIAKPFDAFNKSSEFEWFSTRVAEYQYLLLGEGLICRGGIAINKHFSNGGFIFSAGLISAYRVESIMARYPRVVVSPDVIGLIFPDQVDFPEYLIREDDGLIFIDYIGICKDVNSNDLSNSVKSIIKKLIGSTTPSLHEKGVWLSNYSDAVLGTNLTLPRFSGRRVKVCEQFE